MNKLTKNQRIAKLEAQVSEIQKILSVTDKSLPLLNQLDQSIFYNEDKEWIYAAIDADGDVNLYNGIPDLRSEHFVYWHDVPGGATKYHLIATDYDTTNWTDSLIKREAEVELTGSDLARAMLARGDKYISGFGHHHSDKLALEAKFTDTVSKHTQCFQSSQNAWDYFVPINNQGESLTASEVGL